MSAFNHNSDVTSCECGKLSHDEVCLDRIAAQDAMAPAGCAFAAARPSSEMAINDDQGNNARPMH
jgi:hypothetical protein